MEVIEIKKRMQNDPIMMNVLYQVEQLKLKDALLCAGVIRNYIWNVLSGKSGFDFSTDIDVVFYDETISYEKTLDIQDQLLAEQPMFNWEVKNQVYMHSHNPNTLPYKSSRDAISKFPETCTAIGARLTSNKEIELFCPYGIEDIVQFKVKPTYYFQEDSQRLAAYKSRVLQKDWKQRWPQLDIFMDN